MPTTINELRETIADRDAEIADLKDTQRIHVARLHSLDFCVADNIEGFERLEKEKQGLVDRVRAMQGGIDQWWDYYDWAEDEMDYLYNRKEELKDQIADMEQANVERPEMIEGLRTQLTNLDDENALNVDKVEALTGEVKLLKKRVAQLESLQEPGLPSPPPATRQRRRRCRAPPNPNRVIKKRAPKAPVLAPQPVLQRSARSTRFRGTYKL